jgi:hypothetical protein
MPICTKTHLRKQGSRVVVDPHEYIAGICITHMTPQTLAFLEYTYPFHRSKDYEKSKRRRPLDHDLSKERVLFTLK